MLYAQDEINRTHGVLSALPLTTRDNSDLRSDDGLVLSLSYIVIGRRPGVALKQDEDRKGNGRNKH